MLNADAEHTVSVSFDHDLIFPNSCLIISKKVYIARINVRVLATARSVLRHRQINCVIDSYSWSSGNRIISQYFKQLRSSTN